MNKNKVRELLKEYDKWQAHSPKGFASSIARSALLNELERKIQFQVDLGTIRKLVE